MRETDMTGKPNRKRRSGKVRRLRERTDDSVRRPPPRNTSQESGGPVETADAVPSTHPQPGASPGPPVPSMHPQEPTGDQPAYISQHAYLVAHPHLDPYGYGQAAAQATAPSVSYHFPAQTTPPPMVPVPAEPTPAVSRKDETSGKEGEKRPESIYLLSAEVCLIISLVSVFLYSLVFLYLYSQEFMDPASFVGIWGLGPVYTLFAVGVGMGAFTVGIVGSVFLHSRTRFRPTLLILLAVLVSSVVQVNFLAAPFAGAAFGLVSMCQDLFDR